MEHWCRCTRAGRLRSGQAEGDGGGRPRGPREMVAGDGAPDRAQSGSFRPFPVMVQTTREPRRDLGPLALAFSRPATLGRGGQFAEHRLPGGQQPVGGQDLPVGHRVDQAAGLVAGRPRPDARRAGFADPDRGSRSSAAAAPARRSLIGAAPLAWNPKHPGRAGVARARRAGTRCSPSSRRVMLPGVAHRQAVHVGRVAEVVDDLERGALLALQPVRVDRV